jgi:hypothetical protein
MGSRTDAIGSLRRFLDKFLHRDRDVGFRIGLGYPMNAPPTRHGCLDHVFARSFVSNGYVVIQEPVAKPVGRELVEVGHDDLWRSRRVCDNQFGLEGAMTQIPSVVELARFAGARHIGQLFGKCRALEKLIASPSKRLVDNQHSIGVVLFTEFHALSLHG